MRLTARCGIFPIILIIFAFGGPSCRTANIDDKNLPANIAASESGSQTANTSAEELGLLIKLPFVPDDVVWKQAADGKTLTAVLLFSASDAARFIAEMPQSAQSATIAVEEWFPAELIANGGLNGEDTLSGPVYPADAFFQAPFTSGRLTRVEKTNYFILELAAR